MPTPRLATRLTPLLLTALVTACSPTAPEFAPPVFFASFDAGFAADIAAGDATLYSAPSPDALDALVPVSAGGELVRRVAGGRAGHALRFSTDWNPVVLYRAEGNMAYAESDWSGTISLWLKVDPDAELAPGYSDPFLVTDKNWDDAALYIDFTEADSPRRFRFAAFANKAVWNPDSIAWDDVAPAQRPMIEVTNPPFTADAWTHVVLVYEGLNTGGGSITGYLNGAPAGYMTGRDLRLTWDSGRAVMLLGRHYAGMIDEVAIFDRPLDAAEVGALYATPAADLFHP